MLPVPVGLPLLQWVRLVAFQMCLLVLGCQQVVPPRRVPVSGCHWQQLVLLLSDGVVYEKRGWR